MADPHKRDFAWQDDLIWHYFHDVTTPATTWAHWYKEMDPFGELNDRHRVYELLVGADTAQNNPNDRNEMGISKIPWNQNNAGFLKRVGGQYWCGSLVKIMFTRYMGWNGVEPTSQSVAKKGFDPVLWTIEKLKKNIPVRAGLGGHHFVGIVGHRCQTKSLAGVGPLECSPNNEFLVIEPWARGVDFDTTIIYAGAETGFLGVIKQNGPVWQYGKLLVSSIEAP